MEERTEAKTDELVVIRNYDDPIAAHIDAGVLKIHGIECVLFGQYANHVLYRVPLMRTAIDATNHYSLFPIRLSVMDSQVHEALQVLGLPLPPAEHEQPIDVPRTWIGQLVLFLKVAFQEIVSLHKPTQK